jgi:D-serine deaminase-like pyridoxal phosphate-dependent protein
MTMKEWYSIDNVAEIDTPQVVVFVDRVEHNIRSAIGMVGDVNRLRPHIKTNKTAEVVRMMINAGISKFKCATIEEAELLAAENAEDVLLAYQPVGPKIARFAALIAGYPATRFSCLTDHPDAAKAISDYFSSVQRSTELFIDLNVGMNRTGIAVEDAFELYKTCLELPGLKIRGLHAYDGHFRDPDIEKRKQACDENFRQVDGLRNRLVQAGHDVLVVVGGSPTFPIHAQRANVECSPGTFVFWDKGYSDICAEQPFLPAAMVLSRVISLPFPGKVCLDLGHKSIAAENDVSRRAFFANEPDASLLSQSEEHGLVEPAPGAQHKPGDLMYVIPYHVCPTVNLYEKMVVVKDHKVAGTWRIAAKH